MTLRLFAAAGVVVLAALHSTVSAQQGTLKTLPDDPGIVKTPAPQSFSAAEFGKLGATAADARTFQARVQAIADAIRAVPVWNPVRGVDGLLSITADADRVAAGRYRPLAAYMLVGNFDHFVIVEDGRERDKQVAGETSLVMITVNSLPQPGRTRLTDAAGDMFEAPARTGEFGGFPAYGDAFVVTPSTRPTSVPVPMERALTAAIAQRRKEAATAEAYIAQQERLYAAFIAPDAVAARQKKYADAVAKVAAKGDAAATEHERRYWERDEADNRAALEKGKSRDPKVSHNAAVVAGLKAAEDQLAAMTPAARAGQACYADTGGDGLRLPVTPAGTAGCQPLVGKNPDFFDTTLPRTVPQIVVVSRFLELENVWKLGRAAAATRGSLDQWTTYEVLRQTDWRKIAGTLGR
jgi:hypothetical protein